MKILKIFGVLLMCLNISLFAFAAADQWDKTEPQGTQNMSDIDTLIQTNNEALDRLLINKRGGCSVIPLSSTSVKILSGTLALSNSAESVVRYRRLTSDLTGTWADIDAGAEANSTQYYVYGVADADATTFTASISTSSSAPSGVTYYRKIGYFYNDSGGDIVSVGNVKEGGVSNIISVEGTSDISTTSTSYTDMTDMTIYFVSSGRPVRISFAGPLYNSANSTINTVADVDGTDYSLTFYDMDSNYRDQSYGETVKTLSSGEHTIKVQWKVSGGTGYQSGSSDSSRRLTVEEL